MAEEKPKRSKVVKSDKSGIVSSDGNEVLEEPTVPKKRRAKEIKRPKEVRVFKKEEEEFAKEPESDFADYLKKVGELLNDSGDGEVDAFVRDLADRHGFGAGQRWVEGELLMRFNKTVIEIQRKLSSKTATFRGITDEYLNSKDP